MIPNHPLLTFGGDFLVRTGIEEFSRPLVFWLYSLDHLLHVGGYWAALKQLWSFRFVVITGCFQKRFFKDVLVELKTCYSDYSMKKREAKYSHPILLSSCIPQPQQRSWWLLWWWSLPGNDLAEYRRFPSLSTYRDEFHSGEEWRALLEAPRSCHVSKCLSLTPQSLWSFPSGRLTGFHRSIRLRIFFVSWCVVDSNTCNMFWK